VGIPLVYFTPHSQWPDHKDYLVLVGRSEYETKLTVHLFLEMCELLGVSVIELK
jgi:hypothetical protein